MSEKETIEKREHLLSIWNMLEWRHHGIGMLQAYVPGKDIRVHIWHPSLARPGMVTSGAMHNHRFGFKSTILCGSILHSYLRTQESAAGAHQLFHIENASRGRDSDLVAGPRVTLTMEPDQVFGDGRCERYYIGKWSFHWARPHLGLAVTWVEIHDKDESKPASMVCPYGIKPVHAFTHQRDAENELQLLRATVRYLRGEPPFQPKVPKWAGMDDFSGSDY